MVRKTERVGKALTESLATIFSTKCAWKVGSASGAVVGSISGNSKSVRKVIGESIVASVRSCDVVRRHVY